MVNKRSTSTSTKRTKTRNYSRDGGKVVCDKQSRVLHSKKNNSVRVKLGHKRNSLQQKRIGRQRTPTSKQYPLGYYDIKGPKHIIVGANFDLWIPAHGTARVYPME